MHSLELQNGQSAASVGEDWSQKALREITVVGGGAVTGITNGLSETASHPLEFGANLATSAALMLAMRGPTWTKLPASLIGLAGTVDFGVHSFSDLSRAVPAMQDLWASGKNTKSDRAAIEQNLGPLAFNVASMGVMGLGIGHLSGRLARSEAAAAATKARAARANEHIATDSAPTAIPDATRETARQGGDGGTYHFNTAPVTNESWRNIFESEFPADERQPYEFLHSLAADGSIPQVKLQLTQHQGQTVAFSMTSDYGELAEGRGLLLPYIAVEKNLQGQGIGGAHLEQMFAEAKANYPSAKGMIVEAEDPHAAGISPEDMARRQRRIDWYESHNSHVLDKQYLIPSAEEGAPPLAGKLIWRDFDRGGLSNDGINALIARIYEYGYELPADHPIVQNVLKS